MTGHVTVTDEDATRVSTAARQEERDHAEHVSRYERSDRWRADRRIDPLPHHFRRIRRLHGRLICISRGRHIEHRRAASVQRREIPLFTGRHRKADRRRRQRHRDRHRHHHAVSLRPRHRFDDGDIRNALHPSLGLVPEGASSLLVPRAMGHQQRAFAMLVMGHTLSAEDARAAGFVNTIIAPDHLEAEARKAAREICALPAEAVAISRKSRLPPKRSRTLRSIRKAICSANGCARRKRSRRSRRSFRARGAEREG